MRWTANNGRIAKNILVIFVSHACCCCKFYFCFSSFRLCHAKRRESGGTPTIQNRARSCGWSPERKTTFCYLKQGESFFFYLLFSVFFFLFSFFFFLFSLFLFFLFFFLFLFFFFLFSFSFSFFLSVWKITLYRLNRVSCSTKTCSWGQVITSISSFFFFFFYSFLCFFLCWSHADSITLRVWR